MIRMRMVLPLIVFSPFWVCAQPPVLNEDISPTYFQAVSYPLPARLQRVQGTVVVKVTLDSHGNVTAAVPVSGAKALIDDSIAASKKWRFKPNSEKAAVIVFHFKIEGLC